MKTQDLIAHIESLMKAEHPSFTPKQVHTTSVGSDLYLQIEGKVVLCIVEAVKSQAMIVRRPNGQRDAIAICDCTTCHDSPLPFIIVCS